MKGAVFPVLKSEDSEAWEQTALPTETFLFYNKLRARGIFLSSCDYDQKQRRYYLSIFHPNHSVDIMRYSQAHNQGVWDT